MTNFMNDQILHDNLDRVVDEIMAHPLSESQRKKVMHLSDKGHYMIDELEVVSSSLCNKVNKYNGGNDDSTKEQRLHL